jgi:hypothetical protein
MAIPTTGISTSLIAKEIGEPSSDVGTLCKSEKVNMMAINKPTKYPEVATNS